MQSSKAGINARVCAYAILRITVGLIFIFFASGKFIAGPTQFAKGLQHDFAKTWLPPGMIWVFGCVLPFVEVTVGGLLTIGLFTTAAALAGALLIMALTIGLTISGNAGVVAQNLSYAGVFFLLVQLNDQNRLSIDALLRGD